MVKGETSTHTARACTDVLDFGTHTVDVLCGDGNLSLSDSDRRFCVDWSCVGFMSITQIVGLTQAMIGMRSDGVRVSMIRPTGEVSRYTRRMNLYRLLGLPDREEFQRHNPGTRFIPMTRIDSDEGPKMVANAMCDIITAHVGEGQWLPSGQMNLAFGEIMDNVLRHAESRSWGIAAAQYYPNSRLVELCVADSGRGIVASMGSNDRYREMSRDQLMRLALEPEYGEYVGKTAFEDDKTSGGMGLTYAANLARVVKGRMWIVSHENAIEVTPDGVGTLEGLYYPGTLVSLRLPVSTDLVVLASQVFENGPDIPVIWTDGSGWTDLMGRQVDVNGLTGADSGLW